MNALQVVSAAVFWICAALIFYVYAGYPVVIWCLSRWFGRPLPALPRFNGEGKGKAVGGDLPTVSLLIAAHNEEAVIEKRIQTALMTDYPRDKFEVVVASDGSSDATARIVRGFARRGVRLLDYAERRGKAAVLNAALPEVWGDIVLLSDANTQTDPSALRRMI